MILRGMKGLIRAKLVPGPSIGSLPQYESNLDCLWSILGKKDNTILLRFAELNRFATIDIEYGIDCGYDYLAVSVLSTSLSHQKKLQWNLNNDIKQINIVHLAYVLLYQYV